MCCAGIHFRFRLEILSTGRTRLRVFNCPPGLKESDRLPEPIFTPSTKAELGEHDINIDFAETARLIGQQRAEEIRDLSLAIYRKGVKHRRSKGYHHCGYQI